MPLTTGSVFFKKEISDDNLVMPISQGQLNFTPVGKYCIVKMSVSPNIIVKDSDKETARDREPSIDYNYKVTVSAEIEVHNFKDTEVDMMINRDVVCSEITKSSEDWKVVRTTRGLNDLNQNNLIRWTFKVGANDKKVVKDLYVVFVR